MRAESTITPIWDAVFGELPPSPEQMGWPSLAPASRSAVLAAARTREQRLHAELLETARRNLDAAWCCSSHRAWMLDAWDFLCEEDNCWWRYESESQKLRHHLHRLHVEGHSLYSHEEDEVREVAKALTQYSHALRAVAILEKRRYVRAAHPQNKD